MQYNGNSRRPSKKILTIVKQIFALSKPKSHTEYTYFQIWNSTKRNLQGDDFKIYPIFIYFIQRTFLLMLTFVFVEATG